MTFGKEKYSREKFEEADSALWGSEADYEGAFIPWPALRMNLERAQKRVEKLVASAHKEALATNQEYDRLKSKVEDALKELEQFEKEKLGMHKEEQNEKGEQ